MRKTITFNEIVDDFIAINEFRLASIIKGEFNGAIEKFFNASHNFKEFITKSGFEKNRQYQINGHEIYENISKFNHAGWGKDELIMVCGVRNYGNADFMARFREELERRSLTYINKGFIIIKKTRIPFSPKWLPSKERMEEIISNKTLWTIDESGKEVLNYDLYSKRQASIIKKLLGIETKKQKKQEQKMKEQAIINYNPKKDKEKKARTQKKRQNTLLKNEILETVEEKISGLEKKISDLEIELEEALKKIEELKDNESTKYIDEEEWKLLEDAPIAPKTEEEIPEAETESNAEISDDEIDEENTFDFSKWLPERFFNLIGKAIDKQAIGTTVIQSWNNLFRENEFKTLMHKCSEHDKNPNYRLDKSMKAKLYVKLLPYIENDAFFNYTMPKTIWNDAEHRYEADRKAWENVKKQIRDSLSMISR